MYQSLFKLYLLVAALCVTSVTGATNQCQFAFKGKLEGAHVYHLDEFSIYYDLVGPRALFYQEDKNQNQIPDVVEDMAIQLSVARSLFSDVLGLVHPLKQPRYQGVTSIRIRLTDLGKDRGKAFDEPHRFSDQNATTACSLLIKMSHSLDASSYTPMHELFHLYQYGYAPFKSRWFLEGMARWSESLLNDKTPTQTPLPSMNSTNVLFGKSYDAVHVWQTLAMTVDSMGEIFIPEEINKLRYVNGNLVIADNKLYGAAFIKHVLESFADYSLETSARLDIDPYHWDEQLQTSHRFDDDLWGIVLRSAEIAVSAQVTK